MKTFFLAIFVSLLFCRALLAADALLPRVAFDATRTTRQQWDVDDGIELDVRPQADIAIHLKDKPYASAAPMERVPYDESDRLTVKFGPREGGADLTVQIEWLDNRGQLVEAVKALAGDDIDKGFDGRALADFLPDKGREKIKRFRVKLWIGGGDGASATVTDFRITAARRWRASGVQLKHAYDASAKIEPEKGIDVKRHDDALLLTLDPAVPFTSSVLPDRVAYEPSGVVMLDLGQMRGSVTLQVLCWDESGGFLKAIDLMKDVLEAGTYEAPLSSYAKQIPPRTKELSFKLWLGGKTPTWAWFQGIYYGASDAR